MNGSKRYRIRNWPITVAGYRFKFVKLKDSLLDFGIRKNRYMYSDMEKTILDFIYIWRYNGIPREKILMDLSEYKADISKETIQAYAENYPKTVQRLVEVLF